MRFSYLLYHWHHKIFQQSLSSAQCCAGKLSNPAHCRWWPPAPGTFLRISPRTWQNPPSPKNLQCSWSPSSPSVETPAYVCMCCTYLFIKQTAYLAKSKDNLLQREISYLWNPFSHCRMNQPFKHTVSVLNIKKMLSPGDPSVLTALSYSSSFQIALGFCPADSEKFQPPFQFFRLKPESWSLGGAFE